MTLPAVQQQRDRLDSVFDLVGKLTPGDPLQAHLVQYLCIRVSGFFEQATRQIYYEHARARSAATVARYVTRRLERTQNLNSERLCQLAGQFDPAWQTELEDFLEHAHREAIGSVLRNRNLIAHGESVSLGLHRLKNWYAKIIEVVDFLERQAC